MAAMAAMAAMLALVQADGPTGALVLFDEQAQVETEVAAQTRVESVRLVVVGEDDGVAPVAGTRMLRLSGECAAGDGPCHVYVRFAQAGLAVTPDMRLSYCVYARPESVDYSFAVDLAAPSFYPENLRDRPDAVDQDGNRAHPAYGGGVARQIGRWRYRGEKVTGKR